MNRIMRWGATALFLGLFLNASLSSLVAAQDDAAKTQLDETAAAMLALQTFHFELKTTAGTTSFQDAFELEGVTGDVARPSSFQATVDVKLAIISLSLDVIGIGTDVWVKNPIGGGDEFIQVTGGDSDVQLPPTLLLNPDKLVHEALNYLDDPKLDGTEEVDGQELTVLTGSLSLADILGAGTPIPELEEFNPARDPLDVKMWIDDQDRLVRIDFSGPLFSFEEGSGRLVRSITFSDFDAPLTIEPPA